VIVHITGSAPWWYAVLTTAAVTLLSVLIAQAVVLRIERRRAAREDDRRFEKDAAQAVGTFLSRVYSIDSDGGDLAMDEVRSAALAMDIYLNDALASSAGNVVTAAAAYLYMDELDETDDTNGRYNKLSHLRRRRELHMAARKFHNDFRASRGLPRRDVYVA
jgi:hypothetical protein